MKIYKTLLLNLDKILLLINELFSKAFSFLLFWILGIKLIKDEFAQFTLEMPFIFLFSTVLSFGSFTYFLEQKKNEKTLKDKMSFSLTLVLLLNLLVLSVFVCLYYFNLIKFNSLLLMLVTISLNINNVLTEFYFVLKKNVMMVYTNVLPKILFFVLLFFLLNKSEINLNQIYYIFIICNVIFSILVIKYIKFNFDFQMVIDYFKFSWILTVQPLLIYMAYVSFRYFISYKNDSEYLIEFSVLQTYMGFFALLVSMSNRIIIHDFYEALISNVISETLKMKIYFFNKLFFLFGFIYFHIVLFYLTTKLNLESNVYLFVEMLIMVLASLIYFISQYTKSILVFNKKFGYLLKINIATTFLSILFSAFCMMFEINLLYPLSIFLINLLTYVFYLHKIDWSLWRRIMNLNFIFKIGTLLVLLFALEFIFFEHKTIFVSLNIVILFIIIYDITNYLLKVKKIISNKKVLT